MDFTEGLPKIGDKLVILNMINRFSKYGHFISLACPYMRMQWLRFFWRGGLPPRAQSVVYEHDPVFISTF